MRDPYEVLGVGRDATPDEIKAAFRKAAAKHHPDRNPNDDGAQQRFKELNAAYQLLSDPQKRQMFDRFGAAGTGVAGPGGGPGFSGAVNIDLNDFAQSIPMDGLFGDLLERLGFKFGDRGDLQQELIITLEEAAAGVEKELHYQRAEVCKDCLGAGGQDGNRGVVCTVCQGRGRVKFQQPMIPVVMERECSKCAGRGRVITEPCRTCKGAGLKSKEHTLVITLPPGIEEGAQKIVEGAGNVPRPDRHAGDLEITVRIAPHPIFKRVGDDLVCAVPVSFPRVCLGGEIEVPTIEGKGRLKIPAGTPGGTMLRIRGKGMPRRGSNTRGDEMVEIRVETPGKLSDRARTLLEELDAELGQPSGVAGHTEQNHEPHSKSFVDKIKDFFG